ncbi:MAG TPA: hypothetical protein VFW53_08860 [Gallionella sp.]|nr:hypothetical protein [Gallionella sp.]
MSGEDKHATLDVVLFSVGELRAGFEARLVRALRPALDEARDGEVVTMQGLTLPANTSVHQYLQLKRTDGDKEVFVGSPVELVSLPVGAIHPLPPLLAARCKLHGLRALAMEGDARTIVLLFNADVLNFNDQENSLPR